MSNTKKLLTLLIYTALVSITIYYSETLINFYSSLWILLLNIVAILGGIFVLHVLGNKLKITILSTLSLISYLIFLSSYLVNIPNNFDSVLDTPMILFSSTLLFAVFFTDYYQESLITRFFVLNFVGIPSRLKGIFYDFLKDVLQIKVSNKETETLWRILKSILLFLIIGLPVVILVLGLLVGVNDEFKILIDNIGKLFPTNIFLLIFSVIVGLYFLSEIYLLLNFKKYSGSFMQVKIESPSLETNKTIIRTIALTLLILNIFYIAFIFLDITGDVFSTKQLLLDKNIRTYSEFAVDRFWNLIMITLINIFVIYVSTKPLSFLNKSNSKYLRPFIIINVFLTFIATIALVISTNQRLNLYVSGYGYTEIRLLAQSFLPILIIILGLILAGVFTKNHREKLYQISIGLFLLFISVFNILPATYFVTNINYNLAKKDKIDEYDKFYGVSDNYSEVYCLDNHIYLGSYYSTLIPEGIFVAVQMLKDDSYLLNSHQKECLIDLIRNYRSKDTGLTINLTKIIVRDYLEKNKAVYE